jgi:hypothetical protein
MKVIRLAELRKLEAEKMLLQKEIKLLEKRLEESEQRNRRLKLQIFESQRQSDSARKSEAPLRS